MTVKRYPFEGEQLRFGEILARVPCLSESSVRRRLAVGLDTRQKMLAWDDRAARQRAGRLGRAAAEAKGIFATSVHGADARQRASRSGFQEGAKP